MTGVGGSPSSNGDVQALPVTYPAFYPGILQQNEEQNHGRGLYAVAPSLFMGPTAAYSPNTLIPFTYNLPTASETRGIDENQGQVDHHPHQQHQQPHQLHPPAQREVVVRRFQVAFQLDLFLILKLVAVIFLFNQDGSRQRLVVLVFFASLIYLYQTGALAPLIRWLSQGMQRAAAPPRPPRPAVRAENIHAPEGPGDENVPVAEAQPRGENENQPVDGNRAAENEPAAAEHGGVEGGQRWWGIVKEIQMIVFGFITSLLPGFHNID